MTVKDFLYWMKENKIDESKNISIGIQGHFQEVVAVYSSTDDNGKSIICLIDEETSLAIESLNEFNEEGS